MSLSCAWYLRVVLPLGGVVMMLVSGCGNSLNCALKGDNLRGRVTFAENVPVLADTSVVVEWSNDSFSTISGRTTQHNLQGLLSVPYSLCVDNNVDLQVRAYEDIDKNATPDTGEPSGRYDQTSSGDAAFMNVKVPAPATSTGSSSQDDWEVREGVDIVIDTP